MRYLVRPSLLGKERRLIVDNQPGHERAFCSGLTTAEAEIMAFALNAVADGFTLEAHGSSKDGYPEHRLYEGPRAGVAP